MLSSGIQRYHMELMLSGTTCYHLGLHVIIWDAMLSSGANVIISEKMISSGANVIMVSSGANVIIWCYHVMLSSGMITHPFFIFPENFTHSWFGSGSPIDLPYKEQNISSLLFAFIQQINPQIQQEDNLSFNENHQNNCIPHRALDFWIEIK
jgi:hypothetical protein